MVEDVGKILRTDIREVVASPLSVLLLKCYSVLYLNGGQPRFCEASQRKYYNQLKVDGMERAKLLEAVKSRTCEPAWNGLKYYPATGEHINNEWITDEQAIKYLKLGLLKERDFITLPKLYKVNETIEPQHNAKVDSKPKQKHKAR
jgi:hypothetical protein